MIILSLRLVQLIYLLIQVWREKGKFLLLGLTGSATPFMVMELYKWKEANSIAW